MYMKGPGIVWVWNLVSESKHDVKWRNVFFLFSSAVSFSTPCGRRLALQRPSITKTGQFFKDYFTVLGFTFQKRTAEGDRNENGGQHAGGGECWFQPCDTESIPNAHPHTHTFKSWSRQKAPFLPCRLILQQTQQKPECLIYFNLTSNVSALAAVPVCCSKSSAPELVQIFAVEVTLLTQTNRFWLLREEVEGNNHSQYKPASQVPDRSSVEWMWIGKHEMTHVHFFIDNMFWAYLLIFLSIHQSLLCFSPRPACNLQFQKSHTLVHLILLFITAVIFLYPMRKHITAVPVLIIALLGQ